MKSYDLYIHNKLSGYDEALLIIPFVIPKTIIGIAVAPEIIRTQSPDLYIGRLYQFSNGFDDLVNHGLLLWDCMTTIMNDHGS